MSTEKLHKNIIIIAVLLLITSCASTRTSFPDVSKDELKAEQDIQRTMVAKNEWEKEQRHKKAVIKAQPRLFGVSDLVTKAAIDMCAKVAIRTELCVYEFNVEYGTKINAWTDGKVITLTTAMMNFAKEDKDLAFVLAHEVAHNMMQHISLKKKHAFFGSFLGKLADGMAKSQGIKTNNGFKKVGKEIGVLAYSQDMEREADYIGLYIAYNADYDIKNVADFWRRLSLKHKKSLYSNITHPTNPERFVALTKTLKEINNKVTSNQVALPTLANVK